MKSFIAFFFVFLSVICAKTQALKILQVVPFGEGHIKVTFNREVTSSDLKQYSLSANRSIVDIKGILTTQKKNYNFPNKARIQIAQYNKTTARIILQAIQQRHYQIRFSQKNLYIELKSKQKIQKEPVTPKQAKQAGKIQQARPKKRIVIDAGHGGRDCGALGVLRVCEKVVTLAVARLLKDELIKRGYAVYMTRDADKYLGLRERTNFANDQRADLFVSIHANSVPKTSSKTANGVETYFLSTARSERARRVAEKENKDSIEVMNYFSKQTFLNFINAHRLIASNKLAIDIQGGILNALRQDYAQVLDGGVREGPFWVLAGALMPSVLIEIGYISHPQEGRRITHREYQKLLAKGIADGIAGYFAKNP
ncbi:N-acetylmuramoyl-L-alanine amidase [Helicobacter sp. faydin-H17]|uniref:N-acetylmuramoyl-L-alanine amidase family protein n=1 Tax=Helicobacter kayseriensis TaxID=2905877 RepID=UPI001E3F46F3|nr:N-acetylmuramoyl-L-alanine amidase [Helicobacter kayseriensis]